MPLTLALPFFAVATHSAFFSFNLAFSIALTGGKPFDPMQPLIDRCLEAERASEHAPANESLFDLEVSTMLSDVPVDVLR